MMSPGRLQAFVLFTLSFLAASLSHGSTLPNDEVLALGDIAMTLGIPDWDPTVNPCQWGGLKGDGIRNITCDCSFLNGTICHVTEFTIQRQSLRGTLPPDFVRLPYLENLDLTWNYLNGTIPPEWGSMAHPTRISVVGNRLSGPIPKEIGNISTLVTLLLEANRLSGDLPPEIGKLSQLQDLILTSNYFTGKLPETFAQLTALRGVGLGDNNFTGSIPDFFRNWTNLVLLEIRGTGMQGPIPSAIEALKNLINLRISDLNGTEAPFPQLSSRSLQEVVLRSCNLAGELPDYLANITSLQKLDVSFNKLTGKIPSSYQRLTNIQYMFLNENLLSGSVPEWIRQLPHVDLSYNNFTYISNCQNGTVNLFASSSKANNSEIVSFFGGVSCKQSQHELRINCGGEAWSPVESGKENEMPPESDFDSDDRSDGSSTCFKQPNWAYSSTGRFDDADNPNNDYHLPKQSKGSSMTYVDLYKTARVSPISLTYYGFCLMSGNYNVSLRFAEIMFANDGTYKSLGRRIFDVYIQGKRVLKDFNIADEAGGAAKQIRSFNASIIGDTLEIRFIWAGKGTAFIPYAGATGAYGPLISAISAVKVDIKELAVDGRKLSVVAVDGRKLSVIAVVGIVIAVAIVIFLALYIIWSRGCCKREFANERDLKDLELQTSSFTLRQIKAATNNFDAANKIGEGGFGSVYKGLLPDGTIIAVKQLSSKSRQGNREFLNEIGMISALQHPHLVKLYGCCIEGNQLLLVYEYMENNNLARALFGPEEFQITLSWSTRYMICLGIAKGLAFLHEESTLKIVHRDIKATNVLLDKDLNPKISDFGLARLDEEDKTHISTRITGTYGYMAPEYAMHGYLTGKADVYSFGIVVLEIVSGQSNISYQQRTEECLSLLDWARDLKKRRNLTDLIDRRMGSNFNEHQVMQIIDIALLCTDVSPSVRPAMSSVVRMLEGSEELPAIVPESSFGREDAKIKALMKLTGMSTLSSSIGAHVGMAVGQTGSGRLVEYPDRPRALIGLVKPRPAPRPAWVK